MDKVSGKLTVYFEETFWVGVFERIEDGKLSVTKVTFGAEPKDYEVQESGIGINVMYKKEEPVKRGDVLLAFVMKKKLFYVKKVYFLLTLFIVNEVHDGIVVNI